MSSEGFTIVRPMTVTDSLLTSSSVLETTPAVYAEGTTYPLNDTCSTGTVGGVLTVWQSLQAANIGHAPPSSPTWWKNIGTVYAEYASGTTYANNDIIQVAATHQVYQSLAAGNVGNAVTDTTKWSLLGNTNRWKCFDKAVNSQTTQPDRITIVITPGALINTVGLLNVDGSSATVSQSVSGYSETVNLQKHEVVNWYDWYYEDLVRSGDVVFTVPPYVNGVLTITIDNPGDYASVGCVIIGKAKILGMTQWDCSGGIISYSGTTTDTFGNTTLVKRSNAKRLNVEVYPPEGFESEMHRILSSYTEIEMLFIGASDIPMTIIYGYLGNFEVPLSLPSKPASIELKGLT